MKKLFIGLAIFTLCTQPLLGGRHHKRDKKIASSGQGYESNGNEPTCQNNELTMNNTLYAKILCGSLLVATMAGGHYHLEQQKLRHEWLQMQVDCWDPCLPKPSKIDRECSDCRFLKLDEYQEVIRQDGWLDRVWDKRIEKYRDTLKCPSGWQDELLEVEGCNRLDRIKQYDQDALRCIQRMEENDHQYVTPEIMNQKNQIIIRDTQRKECEVWAPYLAWQEKHKQKKAKGNPCKSWDPRYMSAQYKDNQPQLVDLRECRFLTSSDCGSFSHLGMIIRAFDEKKECEKLWYQEKNDGESVSNDTIARVIAYETIPNIINCIKLRIIKPAEVSTTNLCRIWDREFNS